LKVASTKKKNFSHTLLPGSERSFEKFFFLVSACRIEDFRDNLDDFLV
jgi:hypothetical protein